MVRAILVVLICAAAYGQSPRFEVASVKPGTADTSNSTGVRTGHGRVTIGNETLKRCIMGAYSVGPNLIVGGPSWLDSDRFQITAKSEQAESDDRLLMEMLQNLLAERFKLAVHRETRTLPALVLEVAKNGPKIEKAEDGPSSTRNGRGLIDAKVSTMKHFAEVLSRQTDLPVVDQTGLSGMFNVKLEWAPDGSKASDERPSLFAALQQLGLRLESRKIPLEVLVIDHAEKPSEN